MFVVGSNPTRLPKQAGNYMKFERSEPTYRPVTIVLETKDEFRQFMEMVDYAYNGSPVDSETEQFAKNVINNLENTK